LTDEAPFHHINLSLEDKKELIRVYKRTLDKIRGVKIAPNNRIAVDLDTGLNITEAIWDFKIVLMRECEEIFKKPFSEIAEKQSEEERRIMLKIPADVDLTCCDEIIISRAELRYLRIQSRSFSKIT